MDIETIDPTKLEKTPFIDVQLAKVEDGYYITNIQWKADQVHPNSVISACVNIFTTFINNVPENLQIQMEEYLMNGFIEGMKTRFDHTRTVTVDNEY
jgi:hypothetical protein